MASRWRLFVKKRGKRRTGSRSLGALAVAVLHISLLALGLIGLYWLLDRALLVEGPAPGWWPWLALVIPIALVVAGLGGLLALGWKSFASTERRAAVAQMASDWDLPRMTVRADQLELPTIPPLDSISNSPGSKLPYRLPVDAVTAHMSVALTAVSLIWNTLVAGFIVQVVQQHRAGAPNWLLTWLMVPFVLAGAWTLVALVRQIFLTRGIGVTLVEISDHPLYPGRQYEAHLSQSGRLIARWLQVTLLCEEQATYQQGTDTRTATAVVHSEIVLSERKFDVPSGTALQMNFPFRVPNSAMHSFITPHNAITWVLLVRGRVSKFPEFERRFPILVYPSGTAGYYDPAESRSSQGVAR